MLYASKKDFKITVLIRDVCMLVLVPMACLDMEQAHNPVCGKMCFKVKLSLSFSLLLDNISIPSHYKFPKCKLGSSGWNLPTDTPTLPVKPFLSLNILPLEHLQFLLLCSPNFRLCQSFQ